MATSFRTTFDARYKGPFDEVLARFNFTEVLASWGTGLTIQSLMGDVNWLELEDSDTLPREWGAGTVGLTAPSAVKVWEPWAPFQVTTIGLGGGGTWVDVRIAGGTLGKTYLVTAGLNLSNGEKRQRSAAVTIVQK